eukprot:COSAG01_NODE_698_length_14177_cov_13.550039_13_plen_89_part_00
MRRQQSQVSAHRLVGAWYLRGLATDRQRLCVHTCCCCSPSQRLHTKFAMERLRSAGSVAFRREDSSVDTLTATPWEDRVLDQVSLSYL